MSRGERCRWAYGSSLPQLREDVVGTVTLSDRTFQRRPIPGVDLSSASLAGAAINGGDATRHDCQRSRQQFPTSVRSAAVDAPLVRLTRQTAPHRAADRNFSKLLDPHEHRSDLGRSNHCQGVVDGIDLLKLLQGWRACS